MFPTTIHVAATESLVTDVIPALEHLAATLRRRADDWAQVVKAGRTHLMDAVPITLGQEAGGWATQAEYGAARLHDVLPRLAQLPIGGTAVGTGLNAPDGFAAGVVDELRTATGLDVLTEAADHMEAQGARDGLVEASGALRTVAVSLFKIANDLRWLGSGPRTGLAELALPDLQPGSSIMPGKVNPVICEATMMVAAQVIGNDATVGFAGAQGNLELNVMMPVMARNVLESARLLAAVARLLADKVVDGAQADEERTREYAESSPSIVTPLNRFLGYEEAASVAKQSLKERKTIREVVLERGHVDAGKLTAGAARRGAGRAGDDGRDQAGLTRRVPRHRSSPGGWATASRSSSATTAGSRSVRGAPGCSCGLPMPSAGAARRSRPPHRSEADLRLLPGAGDGDPRDPDPARAAPPVAGGGGEPGGVGVGSGCRWTRPGLTDAGERTAVRLATDRVRAAS